MSLVITDIVVIVFGICLFALWVVFTLIEDKKIRDNLKQFLNEDSQRRELARLKKEKMRKELFKRME